MRLLYFNPENDLALAANDPHYTPPASALHMATDLQRLPLRWAEEGDQILLREPHGPTPEGGSFIPFPWGWSPLTVTDFLRAGVPAELLPTDAEMQAFRTLAGRATAAEVLRHVRERLTAEGYGDSLTGEAYVCRSLDEAHRWHERFGESIFKQPWSGSGRGLLPAHGGVLTEKNEAWLQRTLRQQGYVMAEPFYHRRTDLALEFWRHADDGRVSYEGLSLFMTTAGGVYAGNIVASEAQKRQFLANIFPSAEEAAEGLALLDATREALIAELSALPPTFYDGPLGVDMMFITPHSSSVIRHSSSVIRHSSSVIRHSSFVIRHSSSVIRHSSFSSPRLLLHPCVEINFRMTMGWLALHV